MYIARACSTPARARIDFLIRPLAPAPGFTHPDWLLDLDSNFDCPYPTSRLVLLLPPRAYARFHPDWLCSCNTDIPTYLFPTDGCGPGRPCLFFLATPRAILPSLSTRHVPTPLPLNSTRLKAHIHLYSDILFDFLTATATRLYSSCYSARTFHHLSTSSAFNRFHTFDPVSIDSPHLPTIHTMIDSRLILLPRIYIWSRSTYIHI
ncbi:hypothetical protein B0H11DRAFT_1379225 [Mycena galericulata]|nr:hypothetical protein B0H11DRAFT_1379225 [Mycena galericulata]